MVTDESIDDHGGRQKRGRVSSGGDLPRPCRMSVEEKLDTLADTLMVMKDLMTKKGFTAAGSPGVRK